jgi:ABC-type uncharacterized transport system ATPase subunit
MPHPTVPATCLKRFIIIVAEGAGMPPEPLLAVRSVAKSFGAVAAVKDVSLPLYAGEVHALVGEKPANRRS